MFAGSKGVLWRAGMVGTVMFGWRGADFRAIIRVSSPKSSFSDEVHLIGVILSLPCLPGSLGNASVGVT